MLKRIRRARRGLGPAALAAMLVGLVLPAAAFAFSSVYYGTIAGSPTGGSYVQSDPDDTYVLNLGAAQHDSTYLACQLFNTVGSNYVSHGFSTCAVGAPGTSYTTGRVYNESSGGSDFVEGNAST